jgi:hypothetical protein
MTKKKLFKEQEPIYRKSYLLFTEPKMCINLSTGEYDTDSDENRYRRCDPGELVEIQAIFCDILVRVDDSKSLYIQPKNYKNKLIRLTPDFCPRLEIDYDNRDQYKRITKGSVKISENISE